MNFNPCRNLGFALILFIIALSGMASPLDLKVTTNRAAANISDSKIIFSHPKGFYQESFELTLDNPIPGTVIHFTLDGSEPKLDSPVYYQPIPIAREENNSPRIALIPTNPDESPDCYIWKPLSQSIPKEIIIRARVFLDDTPASPIYSQSYFINWSPDNFKVPVISIITDFLNLFDHEYGIYVPGITYELDPNWDNFWGTGNYHNRGEDWERPASITLFDQSGKAVLHQDVGLRIHGGGSRSMPIKSLRIYARDRYGEPYMHYPFFPDQAVSSFRRIILRNSGQDFKHSYINDAVSHVMLRHLDLETQSYQPSVVFINGEFWGIHNIRDRIDKYYLEYRKGADPDALDLLTGFAEVVEGSNRDYVSMIEFIEKSDITDPGIFETVSKLMDVDNYIDYIIAKQYIAVEDWPGNNIDYWRPHTKNGRWRWIYYDNDGAFINDDHDFILQTTLEGGTDWPNPDWSTFLFRNLLKNDTFKQQYINRFAFHLENTFAEEHVIGVIDSLAKGISHLMPHHISRWNYPESLSFWESRINRMKRFARLRPCFARSLLIDHFELDSRTFLPDLCPALSQKKEADSDHHHGKLNSSMLIYPNPVASEIVWIELQGSERQCNDLELYSLTGKRILAISDAFNEMNSIIALPVADLMPGIYIVTVRGTESAINQILVVQ